MQIDVFLIKLLFLFFPGIVSYFIIELLTECKSRTPLYHVLYIFALGVISYSFTYIFYFLIIAININVSTKNFSLLLNFSEAVKEPNFINCLFSDSEIVLGNVIFTTLIAIFLGIIITYIIQHGLIHKLAQKYNISKKFSDSTVWGYILNSQDLNQWIVVRDIKNDLMFFGWLVAFSAENKNNELFLQDVRIFKNTSGKFLYETYGLYITRPENEITIEFYKPNEEGNNE